MLFSVGETSEVGNWYTSDTCNSRKTRPQKSCWVQGRD